MTEVQRRNTIEKQPLCIDTETGRFGSRNNAYSSDSQLVSIHTYSVGQAVSFTPNERESLLRQVQGASLLILFNAKFDLGMLRRHLGLQAEVPIWDVQLAQFILQKQAVRMPSLDGVLEHYGLPPKIDHIKLNYWEKGIETDQVPWEELCEYGEGDVLKTYQCYEKQVEEFKQKPGLYKLFRLQCQDLLVLFEMEWNGLRYNNKKCEEQSAKLQEQINAIVGKLSSIYPDVPINFNSSQQLSAFLYGGIIREERRHLAGYYKTGEKTGQPRYSVERLEHTLPRLVQPLRGSEMEKEGVYATNEPTLQKLSGKKEIVEMLLELAKLSKLNETYFIGMPKLNKEMNWPEGELHPTYNQCVAATGRLSSAKPNGQNMSDDFLTMLETQYVME